MAKQPQSTLQGRPAAQAADLVYQTLHDAIVSLELRPGSKVSEADVAAQLYVSRQPVRDAFSRLNERGFLLIRPQRATRVAKISEQAVRQAAFIREALEIKCLKALIETGDGQTFDALDDLLARQNQAIADNNPGEFHILDDAFHRKICDLSGNDFAWTLISDQKSHMDRIRHLSLPANAPRAYREHCQIMTAIRNRDAAAAEAAMSHHLNDLFTKIATTRAAHPDHFEGE